MIIRNQNDDGDLLQKLIKIRYETDTMIQKLTDIKEGAINNSDDENDEIEQTYYQIQDQYD